MYQQQELIGVGRVGRFTREEREEQIMEMLEQAPMAMTLRMIAARLNLSKSPYLRGVVNDMVRSGWLEKGVDVMGNGLTVFVYRPVDITQNEGA